MNRRERPRIIANFAITADGKVTTRARTPANFTSAHDKRRLLEIRALADAILVGQQTVATDTMTMRLPDSKLQTRRRARGLPPEPLRVIVSQRGDLDVRWKVFQSPGARRIVFSTQQMPAAVRRRLRSQCDLHLSDTSELWLPAALATLRRDYGVHTLLCEGGPTLLRSLVELDALDALYLTVAPVIFGGKDAPTLTGAGPDFLPSIARFRLESLRRVGDECFLRYRAARR